MTSTSWTLRTALVLLTLCFAGVALGQVAITEINSNSDVTEDWFELTNAGSSAVDISDWGYDDFPEDVERIAPISGVTSIAAGESVVIVQFDDESEVPLLDQLQTFRDAWGGLEGVQVGTHAGSGLGRDDGVSIFNAEGMLVAQQIYFDPAADPEADLHAGEWVGGNNIDSAIWDPASGIESPQFVAPAVGRLGAFAATDGGLGSPGVVPEPSASLMAFAGLLAIGMLRRR